MNHFKDVAEVCPSETDKDAGGYSYNYKFCAAQKTKINQISRVIEKIWA